MSTESIANRLVELYNEGKALQAEEELYAEDVKSYEQNAEQNAVGKEAVMKKTQMAGEMALEKYKNEATILGINNDSFLLCFEIDMKMKDGNRMTAKEYGFYSVSNDKVSEEYFFFA